MSKIYVILMLVASILQAAPQSSQAQESYESPEGASPSSSIAFPRAILEKLANLTQEDNLWILVPANVTSGSQLHESDFELFKLDTSALLNQPGGGGEDAAWARANGPLPGQSDVDPGDRQRAGRKLNLFRMGKPQVSPLYLVNGTVCRFVNAQPICTTLSTTGLFRGQTPSFPQQQQQQQQQGGFNQQQLFPNGQQLPSQRQLVPQQQIFAQQPQQGQLGNGQFRPAALLDDEQQTVALASSNLTSRSQQAPRPSPRPTSFAARRPLNLLSLARPFRSG